MKVHINRIIVITFIINLFLYINISFDDRYLIPVFNDIHLCGIANVNIAFTMFCFIISTILYAIYILCEKISLRKINKKR